MALGTSLLLIAIGAILRFAVNVSTHGFSVHTIGVILMIVGGVGVVISLLWMTLSADRGHRVTYDERDYAPRRGEYPPPHGV